MYLTARHLEVGKHLTWSLLDNIRQRQKTDVSKDVSHKKNKKMFFLQEELMKRM